MARLYNRRSKDDVVFPVSGHDTQTEENDDYRSDSDEEDTVQEKKQTHGVSCGTCAEFLDHLSSCRYAVGTVRRNQPIECRIVYM